MVRRAVSPDLTHWCLIKARYSSVGGDVPIGSDAHVVTSSILGPVGSISSTQSLGGAHRGTVCVRALIGVSVRVYVGVFDCTMFRKKKS
jgi:hypothetical protein